MPRIVALLTDYGTRDHYAGSLRGAALAACPDAQVVDITHEITAHAIREGAFVLRAAVTAFPAGSVFVAVVDPGVGTPRRGIAIKAGGYFFVGPDNGIFSLILADQPEAEVRELTNAGLFRKDVSSTFHGRDIFAPVGGALAHGTAFEEVGQPIDNPFRYEFLAPLVLEGGVIEGKVIYIDTFGNLVTSIGGASWKTFLESAGADLTEMVAEISRVIVPVVSTFGDVPEDDACAYIGSAGRLEVAVNCGSAVERFEASIGTPVKLNRVSQEA
ncbi:MAG: SAM-dependent chlorinase/fluorinase [Vicinamibacteria bacterium]